MTAIPQKFSFAEARQKQQAEKNNSDLANLAQALEYITLNRQEITKRYNKLLEDLAKLEGEVVQCANEIETGELKDYDAVHTLYQKSRGNFSL